MVNNFSSVYFWGWN